MSTAAVVGIVVGAVVGAAAVAGLMFAIVMYRRRKSQPSGTAPFEDDHNRGRAPSPSAVRQSQYLATSRSTPRNSETGGILPTTSCTGSTTSRQAWDASYPHCTLSTGQLSVHQGESMMPPPPMDLPTIHTMPRDGNSPPVPSSPVFQHRSPRNSAAVADEEQSPNPNDPTRTMGRVITFRYDQEGPSIMDVTTPDTQSVDGPASVAVPHFTPNFSANAPGIIIPPGSSSPQPSPQGNPLANIISEPADEAALIPSGPVLTPRALAIIKSDSMNIRTPATESEPLPVNGAGRLAAVPPVRQVTIPEGGSFSGPTGVEQRTSPRNLAMPEKRSPRSPRTSQ